MTSDELKRRLQAHFTDGLVTIVGSGLSCAEGIPGMNALGNHLLEQIPSSLDLSYHSTWEPIATLLESGHDLESAMLKYPPTPEVEAAIVLLTSQFICSFETAVIEDVFSGKRTLRLTRLFPHLLKPTTGIPVVTTNYERLIEVAAEMAGLGVDTLFVGEHYGRLNPRECQMRFCRDTSYSKGKVYRRFADRITLSKPHGSVDWYQHNSEPIRCPYSLSLPRLIITPGRNKFRTGYDRPFDSHRERANRDIDKASRFLVLGYGFNDDHLETHLSPRIRDGAPTLVLTHSLSVNGAILLAQSPQMTVLTCNPTVDPGTIVHTKDGTVAFNGANIWDLDQFISEVLEP
ncbi:MAG: SIR2 family protein [Pirellulaceae bacterium]|nr:SIR2 family protein [Pirellulaceae bacterium]